MLAKVSTGAVIGLEGAVVEVEVDSARGLPSFVMVGLVDTAVGGFRRLDWSRSAWRIAGCSSWTNCPNSASRFWK